jgi:hypothetical protein
MSCNTDILLKVALNTITYSLFLERACIVINNNEILFYWHWQTNFQPLQTECQCIVADVERFLIILIINISKVVNPFVSCIYNSIVMYECKTRKNIYRHVLFSLLRFVHMFIRTLQCCDFQTVKLNVNTL